MGGFGSYTIHSRQFEGKNGCTNTTLQVRFGALFCMPFFLLDRFWRFSWLPLISIVRSWGIIIRKSAATEVMPCHEARRC